MNKTTTSDNKNNIAGRHIKAYRLQKDMSLREFAGFLQLNGLNWDYNQLDRAERGIRIISDVEISLLSNILKISSKKLLDENSTN